MCLQTRVFEIEILCQFVTESFFLRLYQVLLRPTDMGIFSQLLPCYAACVRIS